MNKNRRRTLFRDVKKFALERAKELYPGYDVYWNKDFGVCVDNGNSKFEKEVVTLLVEDITYNTEDI